MRRPLLPWADVTPPDMIPASKVAADKPEYALVFDPTFDAGHEDVVIDPIEKLLQIEFHAPAVSRCQRGARSHLDGLMRTSARTKP